RGTKLRQKSVDLVEQAVIDHRAQRRTPREAPPQEPRRAGGPCVLAAVIDNASRSTSLSLADFIDGSKQERSACDIQASPIGKNNRDMHASVGRQIRQHELGVPTKRFKEVLVPVRNDRNIHRLMALIE